MKAGDSLTDKHHHYTVRVRWTGNTGGGTATYRGYDRSYDISSAAKPIIAGSSDPSFRGDADRWNPEDLLVASLSACHKLWFLGLCSQVGVVVLAYEDTADGVMAEERGGAGQFTSVTLRPHVTISPDSDEVKATALHHDAHAMCFIARSVNFPVRVEPMTVCGPASMNGSVADG